VAEWLPAEAEQHGGCDVEAIDHAEIGVSFFDEPRPRFGDCADVHTKARSAAVTPGDAYVFVKPEPSSVSCKTATGRSMPTTSSRFSGRCSTNSCG
jgi:hypothetical protein